jgi:hypothetical protein
MPANDHLIQRLNGIQAALIAQHLGGRGMPSATIGNERETFLREFLQKLFPAHRRFATGAITDSEGHLSGQVDIAVEYGFVPSFPMPGTEERLLLAESVALVIEVKSDLVGQWNQVRETTARVKALRRQLNIVMGIGENPPDHIPCIAVGYTGHQTVQGLQDRLGKTPAEERPDGALVIESGCFCGFGMAATGSLGLYAMCMAINVLFTQIGFASPRLEQYARD